MGQAEYITDLSNYRKGLRAFSEVVPEVACSEKLTNLSNIYLIQSVRKNYLVWECLKGERW